MQPAGSITLVKTIAERLKTAREDLGLSQEQVASAAGVTQSTIGNIEAGLRKNPRELLAIAAAVKVSPEWLKTGRGDRKSGSVGAPPPAPPPPGFKDRHEVTESDWALLQDLKTVFSPEELEAIRAKAKAAQDRALALLEERRGK